MKNVFKFKKVFDKINYNYNQIRVTIEWYLTFDTNHLLFFLELSIFSTLAVFFVAYLVFFKRKKGISIIIVPYKCSLYILQLTGVYA